MNSRSDTVAHPTSTEIHVWHLNLAVTPRDCDAFWRVLNPTERDRCSQFRSDIHQRRFIVTQGALRCLLARYLDIAPYAIQFERNEHGKPRLAGTEPDKGLVFNVSHSGDRALFAVGLDLALGVDLEIRRPLTRVEGLVERCFAPSERDYWHSLPASRRLAAFFDVWTRKEAFIKAVGRGLGLGLTRCVLASGEIPRWKAIPGSCGDPDEWSLRNLDLGENISAALCARSSDIHWQLSDLNNFLQ
ncbi:4'-phosphopantetheinyl transferase family protein [Methylocaldum sp.]|uniref:4'-phosphopantetheinyl transferase family protein n=1 Tax=Methylocaldum sp. TaxID=1969727 RepID=UPI002D5F52F4|nr:4'-phosphopantetheinyl transferase superfamily protein [Methylocaldum sp.]HYE36818.1 4'-phosphopantetheinyl transferase superfamily protein [Methylocaldum sp.]